MSKNIEKPILILIIDINGFFLSVLVQWEVIVHFYIYTDKSSDIFRDPYPRMCIQMNDSFVHKVACCLPYNVYIFPPYSYKTKCSANNNPLIREKSLYGK